MISKLRYVCQRRLSSVRFSVCGLPQVRTITEMSGVSCGGVNFHRPLSGEKPPSKRAGRAPYSAR